MADPRKKDGQIYVKTNGKNITFELFDSRKWMGKPDAAAGLYRVCVNRKWLKVEGRKYTFLTYPAVLGLAIRECAEGEALQGLEDQGPSIEPKQRLRWVPSDENQAPVTVWAASTPYLGLDGRWRVPVYFLRQGRMVPGPHVPCTELHQEGAA